MRFCSLFWLLLPYKSCKGINSQGFFLVSNLHHKEWSKDPIMVSKIWVKLSTNDKYLLQFKIQGHLQKRGL